MSLPARAPSLRLVGLTIVAWLLFAGWLFNAGPYPEIRRALGGAPLLEERAGYDAGEVQRVLDSLGPRGRQRYRTFQLLDSINALLMTATLSIVALSALARLAPAGHGVLLLAALPLAAGLAELVENTCLVLLAASYPLPRPSIAALAASITPVKFAAAFAAFLVAAVSLVVLVIARLLRGTQRPSSLR